MKLGVGKLKWAPGAQAALLASAVAGGQEMLHAAVIEATERARNNVARYHQITGQLRTTIHAVLPGESDRPMSFGGDMIDPIPGLHADDNEAFVVMHTIRRPGGGDEHAHGDYAGYQEDGPASKDEPGGRHHLLNAGNAIRGKYPGITVGPVTPGTSFGG